MEAQDTKVQLYDVAPVKLTQAETRALLRVSGAKQVTFRYPDSTYKELLAIGLIEEVPPVVDAAAQAAYMEKLQKAWGVLAEAVGRQNWDATQDAYQGLDRVVDEPEPHTIYTLTDLGGLVVAALKARMRKKGN